ncbi:gluconokinase [Rhodococcus sp. PAMC28707]|uniref:gluconokinase n=1 Tax=unclassified Rhodococcus (in: high G+C Gram-positive bacteria) TaxID=192944 RepID=UPI00109DFA3B|nr:MULTISPECIES: gluconokinase [unclassified Rhodococcus (in: high G+C Gram-positive bacteria)]QCB52433.1 gluconokinase [Rhodococcus sp. PAMC28705]QCB61015.1 gluconokinase [Rhodococcus sp. PAMC28707]
MGVSGSGKSTVAGVLARTLSWDFQEGDDLHPASNVAKMASGVALTDEDRLPWLDMIADWIRSHTRRGEPGIVTCSALKRSYRGVLAHGSEGQVVFVHLVGTRTQLGDRINVRTDHFMPRELLDSQFSTLEPIGSDENALLVDVGPPAEEIAARIIAELDIRRTD